jgi:hypothetical protein
MELVGVISVVQDFCPTTTNVEIYDVLFCYTLLENHHKTYFMTV